MLAMLSIVVLVFLVFISYQQINQVNNANQWITHSYQVIEKAGDVLTTMNYGEIKLRTYLLTNDPKDLKEYFANVPMIYQGLSHLKNMTLDNKSQQSRIKSLTDLINTRIAHNKKIISDYQEKSQAALNAIKLEKQVVPINSIQKIAQEIINEEKRLLTERTLIAIEKYHDTTLFASAVDVLSLLIILLCIIALNRQLSLRYEVEKKLKASENELLYLAYYDMSTGLPNRTMLIKNFDQIIQDRKISGSSIAFLLIEIDNFKSINNSLGYEMGNELLILFSKRLHEVLDPNKFIFHLGSNEFVVVISDIEHIKSVEAMIKAIFTHLRQPFVNKGQKIFTNISMGVSVYPDNGTTAETLLRNADIAMRRAKEWGKNHYQFSTPEMTLKVEERAALDFNLHQALLKGEFVLFYQPKISLRDNKIVGAEALIRWEQPENGLVYPDEFISLAESNGLIIPIGEWLLRKVCTQLTEWIAAGLPPIHVSINISTRQLMAGDFVSIVKKILEETHLDPRLLELELTESILMENTETNLSVLRDLKNLGVKITIDDFGTGYSSLSYLKNFNIDKLKIDKSFIKEITSSQSTHSILEAIIAMAHGLDIQVIAEGVETVSQVNFLRKLGCQEAQGYYYSPPLSAIELPGYIAKHV